MSMSPTLEEIESIAEYGELYDWNGEKFECVVEEEEILGKTISTTRVFKLPSQDRYFEVRVDSENKGYWGDGETYEPQVYEVKPVKEMVEVTKWVGV